MPAPHHPIVYVRGFAATQSEIEQTVADPYMGFNVGSTKARTSWTGDVNRFYFESPLVRLMRDYGYRDVYVDGDDLIQAEQNTEAVPYSSIVIYRYYDTVSQDFGNAQGGSPIEQFAQGLSSLIERLRDRVCANPDNKVTPAAFRVHLVAHSMGGLICRAFLQKPQNDPKNVRGCVDKVFTYATPHNGIDLKIVRNVPSWVTFGDASDFNRDKMAGFFGLAPDPNDEFYAARVTNFPAERIFNLVGTDSRDYAVLSGLSSWAVGEASDGLVRIQNATTFSREKDNAGSAVEVQSPRAFVNRSHSGYYGIVNSEEGYQNLTRFLFGSVRADGVLDIDDISLPPDIEAARLAGKDVRASYQFEMAVSVRGAQWQVTRRQARENSAIFRTYDELFPKQEGTTDRPPDRSKSPHLFSVFLDPWKSKEKNGTVSFAFELKVLVPDYQVGGILNLLHHYEGGSIYNRMVLVHATPNTWPEPPTSWEIRYGFQDAAPGRADTPVTSADPPDQSDTVVTAFQAPAMGGLQAGLGFDIDIKQATRPGFTGKLRVTLRPWQ